MKIAILASALFVVSIFSGCATAEPRDAEANHHSKQSDARMARGLIDGMRSPVHSFPANLPR
jgi:hypothetical protein